MSNKIVPQIYRQIIDDVMATIQADFEEYGMEEHILNTLQEKWEAKLLDTRVAEFNRAPNANPGEDDDSPPADSRTSTASSPPRVGAAAGPSRPHQNGANGGGLALPGRAPNGMPMQGYAGGELQVKQDPEDVMRMRGGAPSADDLRSIDAKPDIKPEPNAAGLLPGDEIIDSDLDDTDDELKDDADEDDGEVDIVFCTYDKVQRVKNKWKTTFKDGMVHINGKDYLFAKCTGEFEW